MSGTIFNGGGNMQSSSNRKRRWSEVEVDQSETKGPQGSSSESGDKQAKTGNATTNDELEIPKDEENFFRLCKLVYSEIPNKLRQFFREKWNLQYPNETWDDSRSSGDAFWKKLSPGAQSNASRRKDIENRIKTGCSSKWDLTVLFDVLLNLLPKFVTKDERQQFNQFREVRNTQCSHREDSKLSITEMMDVFKKVKEIYRKMNWDVTDVEKIEKSTLVTEDVKAIKDTINHELEVAIRQDQENFKRIPDQVENFVGREEELEKIMSSFGNMGQDRGERCLIIHGGPCYGKSSLAIKVGHEMHSRGTNYVIWVDIRAISNPDDLSDIPNMNVLSLKLLQEFGVDTKNMKGDISAYLEKKLRSITSKGKNALLIFDNADGLVSQVTKQSNNTLFQLMQSVKMCSESNIKLLLTSRVGGKFVEPGMMKIELHCLSEEESFRYLQDALKEDTLIDKDSLIPQLNALGHGLPLALKILASNVNESEDKECLIDYLNDVQDSPFETVNEDHPITHLFDASFSYLQPAELNLLKILAAFPSTFSYRYVGKLASKFKANQRLITKLREKGMVDRRGDSHYLIHPFLCEYIKLKKWRKSEASEYEREYVCLYLQSLFRLALDAHKKDMYTNSLEEFKAEKENFEHLMRFIDKLSSDDCTTKEIAVEVSKLLDLETPVYLTALLFTIDLINQSVLVNFFENCEKMAPEERRVDINSCRAELTAKCFEKGIVDLEFKTRPDKYAAILKDRRELCDRAFQFEEKRGNHDQAKLLEDLQGLYERADNFEDDIMRAYFTHKICKLQAGVLKNAGMKTEAEKIYCKGLRISLDAFGNNWLTIDCYHQLAKFHDMFGDQTKVLPLFEDAYDMAEKMGVTKDKRFGSHLLAKGRYLVGTGVQGNLLEGEELLLKMLEMCKEESDSLFWSISIENLAKVKPAKYLPKVVPYLCELSSPRVKTLDLVAKYFKFQISIKERSEDPTVIEDTSREAIQELKKAVSHLETIGNQRKATDEKITKRLQESLFEWYTLLALDTAHYLDMEERISCAKKCLHLRKTIEGYQHVSDVKGSKSEEMSVKALKEMLEGSQSPACISEHVNIRPI